jgi:hypothetical protein
MVYISRTRSGPTYRAKGRPRGKDRSMTNESKFWGAKRARLIIVLFALLAALAMLQAFSAKPASAGVNLIYGSHGTSGAGEVCPPGGWDNYVNGLPPTWAVTWTGTDADDLKCGAKYDDNLSGVGGNDRLFGMGGSDKLYGGTGNDKLYGQSVIDEIVPGDGADWVEGGSMNDTVVAYADGQKDIFYGDVAPGSVAQTTDGITGFGTGDVLKITSCGGLDSVDEIHQFELVLRPSC